MSLTLTRPATFKETIEITVPGQTETGTMEVTFNYKPNDQLNDFIKRCSKDKLTIGEALLDLVVAWNLPEEFNKETLTIFMDNYPQAGMEIYEAYFLLVRGTRVKNSKLLP